MNQIAFQLVAKFMAKPSSFISPSVVNPQEQVKYTDPNDTLIKMLNYDNGSALKDFKAVLDNMKEQFFQDKQKLSLFYQQNFKQLIQDLDIGNVPIEKAFSEKRLNQIEIKLKNVKNNKKPSIYTKYENLMKYSIRQNEKINFIKQTSKKHDLMQLKVKQNSSAKNNLKPAYKIQQQTSSSFTNNNTDSRLQKFMKRKKHQMTVQASSKLDAEEKRVKEMMENRNVCQKILQEALMFERYFDYLKKQQTKQFSKTNSKNNDISFTNIKVKTQPTNGRKTEPQKRTIKNGFKIFPKNRNQPTHRRTQSSLRPNSRCTNPKHLRLQKQQQKPLSHPTNQQQYQRHKYLNKLKRDEYFKRINRINQDIVDKKNFKNNILISSLLNFIRNSPAVHDKQDGEYIGSLNQQNGNRMNKSSSIMKNQTQIKLKKLTGSNITKIFRKVFLIYSFSQSQQIGSKYESIILQQNLNQFLKDFQIDIQKVSKSNDKIKQIISKQHIDQFEFIQLIHLLSLFYDQQNHPTSSSSQNQQYLQGTIHTNVNKFIIQRILNPKYKQFLLINQQYLLRQPLNKTFTNMRKLHRFKYKVTQCINIFIEEEKINKLKIDTMFEDFQNVLEVLWFCKVYPFYINKKKVRFYFDYLKQEREDFLIKDVLQIDRRQREYLKLENILWFVVAKISIEDINQIENSGNGRQIGQQKSQNIQRVFIAKFKTILKLLNHVITENMKRKA